MAAADPDRAVLYRADGRLAMETEAHGNRRGKSLGTKVRRQKPDPAARPSLASGVPPRALLRKSATRARAAAKGPARETVRDARGDRARAAGRASLDAASPISPGSPGLHLRRCSGSEAAILH